MPIGSQGSPVFVAGFGVVPGPMTDISLSTAGRQPARYRITGITRNAAGTALGGCTVDVFETVSRRFVGTTISDASGNYSVDVTSAETGLTFKVDAYLAGGAGDVAGTTVNTLVGTPS